MDLSPITRNKRVRNARGEWKATVAAREGANLNTMRKKKEKKKEKHVGSAVCSKNEGYRYRAWQGGWWTKKKISVGEGKRGGKKKGELISEEGKLKSSKREGVSSLDGVNCTTRDPSRSRHFSTKTRGKKIVKS